MKRIKLFKLLGIYVSHGGMISYVRNMFKNIVITLRTDDNVTSPMRASLVTQR